MSWNPILKKNLLKSVLAGLVNSAWDPQKKHRRAFCCFSAPFELRSTFMHLRLPFFLKTFLVGSMHCLQDSQVSFFNKTFIKNWSHGTKAGSKTLGVIGKNFKWGLYIFKYQSNNIYILNFLI